MDMKKSKKNDWIDISCFGIYNGMVRTLRQAELEREFGNMKIVSYFESDARQELLEKFPNATGVQLVFSGICCGMEIFLTLWAVREMCIC